MNGKFFDLRKEKQDRMINAALKVFAMQGYRHASTDEIVKEADISKGLLFHYFGSKLGVYTFIYDYSVRFVMLELRTTVDGMTGDLFELFRQVELGKMHAMKAYPYIQQFLNRSMTETDPEALTAIREKREQFGREYDEMFRQVNPGTLPDGVEVERVRKMLELTERGLMTEQLEAGSFVPEKLYEEICRYLEMMRRMAERIW